MNRQQALNQLRLMQAWHEDFGNGPCPDYDAICYAIGVIEGMPEGTDTLIKALEKEHQRLLEMQKAQPEIIRCKDCNHFYKDNLNQWCFLGKYGVKENGFCSRAERRTDERSD